MKTFGISAVIPELLVEGLKEDVARAVHHRRADHVHAKRKVQVRITIEIDDEATGASLPAQATDLLMSMTEEERLSVLRPFCKHCGRKQPTADHVCQCWNDE